MAFAPCVVPPHFVQWNRSARHTCLRREENRGRNATMKMKSLALAASLILGGYVYAQDGEQTISLLPEGAELPDVLTAAITLPKDANGEYRPAAKAVERSAAGIATANAAREDGRAFGESTAAQAKENRELRTRGELPDLADRVPDQVPDHVTLPTLPERPALPELPPLPEHPVTPPVDLPVTPPGRP